MSDYFDMVVSGRLEKQLSSSDIESSLEIAAKDITKHMREQQHQSECTSVLMERFVYSDADRRSYRATSLALGILKSFGRQINNSPELASAKAIGALLKLTKQIFESISDAKAPIDLAQQPHAMTCCEEALTCVANAMLQCNECQPWFAQSGGFDVVSEIIGSNRTSSTAAFLCGRCLLLALASNNDVRRLVSELDLPTVLAKAIRSYLDCESGRIKYKQRLAASGRFSFQQIMAELLKAGMSLCVIFQRSVCEASASKDAQDDSIPEEHAIKFLDLLRVSLDVVCTLPITSQGHLADASKQAFSIALNFSTKHPKAIEDIWLPSADASSDADKWIYVDQIYSLFEQLVGHVVDDDDDGRGADAAADRAGQYQTELTPMTLVLVRLVAEHIEVRKRLLHRVYPEEGKREEFDKLPEMRSGISAKLVRILRIPQGGMLPGAIGDFLLMLLGQDVKQFIMAVGYGNAAGYMLARGIDIPADVLRQAAGEDADRVAVDPVTGRAFDQGAIDRELAAMTDEEKEREAERLFVLFERLNKTGVIKVENPVRQAVQSGRFKELSDDDEPSERSVAADGSSNTSGSGGTGK